MPAPENWLVRYLPGPGWLAGKPAFEQTLDGHTEFNQQQIAAGALLVSGPLIGQDGGFALYHAPDRQTVLDLLACDPPVRSGVFVVDVVGVLIAFSNLEGLPTIAPPPARPHRQ